MSSRTFKGVDEVRRALETYEANARRKIDPGARYENIHRGWRASKGEFIDYFMGTQIPRQLSAVGLVNVQIAFQSKV